MQLYYAIQQQVASGGFRKKKKKEERKEVLYWRDGGSERVEKSVKVAGGGALHLHACADEAAAKAGQIRRQADIRYSDARIGSRISDQRRARGRGRERERCCGLQTGRPSSVLPRT
jgi:hypothetical protein